MNQPNEPTCNLTPDQLRSLDTTTLHATVAVPLFQDYRKIAADQHDSALIALIDATELASEKNNHFLAACLIQLVRFSATSDVNRLHLAAVMLVNLG